MKTNQILTLILFCLLFNCDELEELLSEEVTITSTYTDIITIDVLSEPDPNTAISFQEGGGFNLRNDPKVKDIIDNPEQIKKVEIDRVKYEYKDFSGNVDANTVGSAFFISTAFMDAQNFPIANQNIAEADLFGTRFDLNGDFASANNFLTKEKLLSYIYKGKVSHNPAFFRVEVTITVRFTIEVSLEDTEG